MSQPFRIIHTADLHMSNNAEKREESVRTSDTLLADIQTNPPGLLVVAGDSVDEWDGLINLDSPASRAMFRFLSTAANYCPVVVVTGTPSHDRMTPEIFRFIRGRYPIHVSSQIEMLALVGRKDGMAFVPWGEVSDTAGLVAVITCIPSPNKAKCIATLGGELRQLTTFDAQDMLHDALSYIGSINETVPAPIPRILASHGMVSGAIFSTGSVATGEDLEFTVGGLNSTNTDYKAMGHIHKKQSFPGNIWYPGSPGRLSYGEVEEKGYLDVTFEGRSPTVIFKKTPARRFAFLERDLVGNDDPATEFAAALEEFSSKVDGADVRVRYMVSQEHVHAVNRSIIISRLTAAGARKIKIEPRIIPVYRQRAAGISLLTNDIDKFKRWAEVNGIILSKRALELADSLKNATVEELYQASRKHCRPSAFTATTESDEHEGAVNL